MTKTPEAIATDALTGLAPGYPVDREFVKELIIGVIEYEREQKQDAMNRVSTWIDVYETNSPFSLGDSTGASYESAPLLLSDLKKLVGRES